jgi:hypothetical protein
LLAAVEFAEERTLEKLQARALIAESATSGSAVRTVPSAARTVFGVGPGLKVLLIRLRYPSGSPITACCTVWTRQHHLVAIEITKPYLPMVWASISIGRVSVAWHDDFSAHRLGPCNRSVKVVNLKPKKEPISRRHVVRIANRSVMMLDFPAMQLHNEPAGIDEALVTRPAMCAFAIEQPLIPPAACFNIPHAYQWLWSHLVSLFVFPQVWLQTATHIQPGRLLFRRRPRAVESQAAASRRDTRLIRPLVMAGDSSLPWHWIRVMSPEPYSTPLLAYLQTNFQGMSRVGVSGPFTH